METSIQSIMPAMRPGKSAHSVGHMAKAAVAEAKAAGVDLPKNAQGIAASAIAQGVDPASLFAAVVEPEEGEAAPVVTQDAPVEQDVDGAAPDTEAAAEGAPVADPPADAASDPAAGAVAGEEGGAAAVQAVSVNYSLSLSYAVSLSVVSDAALTKGQTALALLDTAV